MNSAWALVASVRGQMSRLRLWLSFAVGTTSGGAVTGALVAVLAGLFSPVAQGVRWLVVALAVVALVVADLTQRRLALPQRTELIPQEVFARGMTRGIARFGVEYGTGFRTLVPSAAPYVLAVFLLGANLPWWQTVLAGAVFGAARSLAVLQFLLLGRDGWQTFLARHTRLLERAGSAATAAFLLAALGVARPA
jgi:hypothetical protein